MLSDKKGNPFFQKLVKKVVEFVIPRAERAILQKEVKTLWSHICKMTNNNKKK